MNIQEADEREKLLRARAEVIDVLTRHGLIAHVVMAGQLGQSEVILHVKAPWSNLLLEDLPDGQVIRLRSKKADYAGDAQAQRRDQESSLGALSAMAVMTGSAAMYLLDVSKQFDEATGATHTGLKREHKQ